MYTLQDSVDFLVNVEIRILKPLDPEFPWKEIVALVDRQYHCRHPFLEISSALETVITPLRI